MFRQEWSRAAAEGLISASCYALHLLQDILRTLPSQWSSLLSRVTLLALAAAGCGVIYLSQGSTPMLLKVLGCACCTGAFAGFAMAFRRSWIDQLKLTLLGVALGFALTSAIGLDPKLTPAPEDPLRPVPDPSLTGPEIYRRMEAAYHEAQTYLDEGRVERVLSGEPLARTQVQSFRTAFVRGRGFRFEFESPFGQLDPWSYVIWQDGSRVKSWRRGDAWEGEIVASDRSSDQQRIRALNEMLSKRGQRTVLSVGEVPRAKPESLERALREASAISGRTSLFIPPLLPIENAGIGALSRPHQIILYGVQRVDGTDAFKVELTNGTEPLILWIDARSYLIRRISRNLTTFGGKPGLRWKETTLYHPQLNGQMGAVDLTFQPGPTPTERQRWIRLLLGNENILLIVALTGALGALMLNQLHRRLLRQRWPETPESWLISFRRRLLVGAMGVGAICIGMRLGGAERVDVWRNLLVAPFMQQGFYLLYVIQRRSRGHARFAMAS